MLIKLRDDMKTKYGMNVKFLRLQDFKTKLSLAYNFANAERKKDLAVDIKLLKKIQNLMTKEKNILSLIHKVSKESKGMKSVFVTFQRIKHKNYFLQMMKKTFRHRLYKFINIKRDKRLMLEDRMLYAVEPPEPINVIWQNYSYSGRNKVVRRILSWIIYVVLYLVRKC